MFIGSNIMERSVNINFSNKATKENPKKICLTSNKINVAEASIILSTEKYQNIKGKNPINKSSETFKIDVNKNDRLSFKLKCLLQNKEATISTRIRPVQNMKFSLRWKSEVESTYLDLKERIKEFQPSDLLKKEDECLLKAIGSQSSVNELNFRSESSDLDIRNKSLIDEINRKLDLNGIKICSEDHITGEELKKTNMEKNELILSFSSNEKEEDKGFRRESMNNKRFSFRKNKDESVGFLKYVPPHKITEKEELDKNYILSNFSDTLYFNNEIINSEQKYQKLSEILSETAEPIIENELFDNDAIVTDDSKINISNVISKRSLGKNITNEIPEEKYNSIKNSKTNLFLQTIESIDSEELSERNEIKEKNKEIEKDFNPIIKTDLSRSLGKEVKKTNNAYELESIESGKSDFYSVILEAMHLKEYIKGYDNDMASARIENHISDSKELTIENNVKKVNLLSKDISMNISKTGTNEIALEAMQLKELIKENVIDNHRYGINSEKKIEGENTKMDFYSVTLEAMQLKEMIKKLDNDMIFSKIEDRIIESKESQLEKEINYIKISSQNKSTDIPKADFYSVTMEAMYLKEWLKENAIEHIIDEPKELVLEKEIECELIENARMDFYSVAIEAMQLKELIKKYDNDINASKIENNVYNNNKELTLIKEIKNINILPVDVPMKSSKTDFETIQPEESVRNNDKDIVLSAKSNEIIIKKDFENINHLIENDSRNTLTTNLLFKPVETIIIEESVDKENFVIKVDKNDTCTASIINENILGSKQITFNKEIKAESKEKEET